MVMDQPAAWEVPDFTKLRRRDMPDGFPMGSNGGPPGTFSHHQAAANGNMGHSHADSYCGGRGKGGEVQWQDGWQDAGRWPSWPSDGNSNGQGAFAAKVPGPIPSDGWTFREQMGMSAPPGNAGKGYAHQDLYMNAYQGHQDPWCYPDDPKALSQAPVGKTQGSNKMSTWSPGMQAVWLPPDAQHYEARQLGGSSSLFHDAGGSSTGIPMHVMPPAWSQDAENPVKIQIKASGPSMFGAPGQIPRGVQQDIHKEFLTAQHQATTMRGLGDSMEQMNGFSQGSSLRQTTNQMKLPYSSSDAMQAMPEVPGHWEDGQCRWHKSAETVGIISEDGHVFTKTAGPRRSRVSPRGAKVELASICMVFDSSLRCGGVHRYCYEIVDGELGAADGAGFVFDSKVRRNNIQRMRSVFLNQRGRICLRNNQQVTKLQVQLPPLTVGTYLDLLIDLDSLIARFNVSNSQGGIGGSADVSLEGLFDIGAQVDHLRSGFFCAVVTGSITIGLR